MRIRRGDLTFTGALALASAVALIGPGFLHDFNSSTLLWPGGNGTPAAPHAGRDSTRVADAKSAAAGDLRAALKGNDTAALLARAAKARSTFGTATPGFSPGSGSGGSASADSVDTSGSAAWLPNPPSSVPPPQINPPSLALPALPTPPLLGPPAAPPPAPSPPPLPSLPLPSLPLPSLPLPPRHGPTLLPVPLPSLPLLPRHGPTPLPVPLPALPLPAL